MTKRGGGHSRKTSRIVRTPATRFGHLQKRLRENTLKSASLGKNKPKNHL